MLRVTVMCRGQFKGFESALHIQQCKMTCFHRQKVIGHKQHSAHTQAHTHRATGLQLLVWTLDRCKKPRTVLEWWWKGPILYSQLHLTKSVSRRKRMDLYPPVFLDILICGNLKVGRRGIVAVYSKFLSMTHCLICSGKRYGKENMAGDL